MSLLDFAKKILTGKEDKQPVDRFDALLEEARLEEIKNNSFYIGEKPGSTSVFTQQLLTLAPSEKVAFILDCIQKAGDWNKGRNSYSSDDKAYQIFRLRTSFLNHFLRTKLTLTEADCITLGQAFLKAPKLYSSFVNSWPINSFLNQVQKNTNVENLSSALQDVLKKVKAEVNAANDYYSEKEKVKLVNKIDDLLHHSAEENDQIKPQRFLGKGVFANFGNNSIQSLEPELRNKLYKILAKAQTASGPKPSAKFLKESQSLIEEFGIENLQVVASTWFDFLVGVKDSNNGHDFLGTDLSGNRYDGHCSLAGPNMDALKGIVWMSLHGLNAKQIKSLAALAERSYQKLPGWGPVAAGLGNACIFSLSKAGMEGVARLSRLKLRIKQTNTQTLIQKYLEEAATAQGVTVHEIEDLAVDNFGLTLGKRTYELEGFTARLELVAVGKTELSWFKPDGTPQKTVPAAVKEKQPAVLKEIKDTAKQIELTSSVQRDRLDRQFKTARSLTWEYFDRHFFSHGLMHFLASRIIWQFQMDAETSVPALYFNQQWITMAGETINPEGATAVSLWHPALATIADIKAWRDFLLQEKILQPLKQAYREVYLLTDAEVTTRIYSNRMAAHLLKQHQFNSLAKIRGWKYSLLGAYDDGRENEAASILLPEYGLRAEFWINEVNMDDAFNDAGIWNYVSTDQVRFVNTQNNEVVPLVEIPVLVLSEVMRDVDLFVGVASVGNDPAWQDTGGALPFRNYWQSYSFGELSEVAKTRKELLGGLIPRLKIAKVAEIQDKFLVVKGKLRTYKIHLGSTNILMEPNDQYLCIVPDRSQKGVAENVFLPFEGDSGLSVILSKAFLLADDDKITDSTITSQIKRK